MKTLSLKRVVVAIIAGLIGFAINLLPYEAQFGDFKLSLMLGLIIPMVIALS